jgi:hypothetical protein
MSEQLRTAVLRYFAEFPVEVGEAIYNKLLTAAGLPGLLKELHLPADGDASEQYARLIRFLRQNGLRQLENLVGRALDGRQIRSAGEDSGHDRTMNLEAEHTQIAPVGPDVKKYSVPSLPMIEAALAPPSKAKPANAAESSAPPKPKVIPATIPGLEPIKGPIGSLSSGIISTHGVASQLTPAQPEAPSFPRGPLKPGIPPDPGTFERGNPSWDPDKPHDPNGKWPEVERRSGRERRRVERRKELDIVYKNRRYGKDRRVGEERRKNWPKDGHIQ